MPATLDDGALTLTLADPLAIDSVLGSSYNDTIIGNINDNTLIGGGGDDVLVGVGGNNLLEGAVTRTVYLDFDTYELPGQHFYTQAERDAIQAQITADYSAFSYVFTQTQPQSGPYTTIYFQRPGAGRPRGGNFVRDRLARSRHLGHDDRSPRTAWKSSPPIPPGSTSITSWAVPASPPPRAPTSSASRPPSPRTSWGTSPGSTTPTRSGRSARASTPASTPTSTTLPIPDRPMPTSRSCTSWPPAPR